MTAQEIQSESFDQALLRFSAENPDIESYEIYIIDLNGLVKGKWIPASAAKKLAKGGARLPRSTYALSVFNDDVEAAGLAAPIGDPDAALKPMPHTLGRVTWADRPTAQVMMQMTEDNGDNIAFDPRSVLAGIADRAKGMGLTPVAALELECYLIAPEVDASGRASAPSIMGAPARNNQVYDLDRMRLFAPVLDDIRDACAALNVPADTAISEFGPGQIELNLNHIADPLLAADHCVLLKRAIRGVARKHGLDATFMPKPYADAAGSGLHLHMSMLDQDGNNVFGSGTEGKPNNMLRWAIGGQAALAPELTLLYAPSQNAYRRMIPNVYAPITTSWGLDDRTMALRAPSVMGMSARFENRIAGADANPYLLMATVLGSAIYGIQNKIDPGPAAPVGGGEEAGTPLPRFWNAALDMFESSDFVTEWMGAEFKRVYTAMKQEELDVLAAKVSDIDHQIYLRL